MARRSRRGTKSKERRRTATPGTPNRGSLIGVVASVAVLTVIAGLWFWKSRDGCNTVPPTRATALTNDAIDLPEGSSGRIPFRDSYVEPGNSPAPPLVATPGEPGVKDDPASDGWSTEVFHEQVKQQLKQLAKLLAHPEDGPQGESKFAAILVDDVRTDSLRPAELAEVYVDGSIAVHRLEAEANDGNNPADAAREMQHLGRDATIEQLRRFAAFSADHHEPTIEFKVFRLSETDGLTTSVLVECSAQGNAGVAQRNAAWQCRWQPTGNDGELKLSAISLTDYEEVASSTGAGRLLSDCTESVLGANSSFRQQLIWGETFWDGRLQSSIHSTFLGIHGGLAVADANGDGLDDLYVCQPGGLPNRLYLQNPDGTATDVSAEARIDWLEYTSGALMLDLDNDGDQDLALLGLHGLVLMRNDGDARFRVEQVFEAPSKPTAMAAADYDNNGYVDLYLVCYGPGTANDQRRDQQLRPQDFMSPIPYDDANNGARNSLLRNEGEWKFVDVTDSCGLHENNSRWSFAAGWEDYDNDGDVDLYVANDFGRNSLYRNDDGHFTDVAAEAGVEDIASGMSVSWGDYNNDGWMDLYVGNMFSAAGGRITYQRNFKQGVSEERVAQFQRMARGNSLFQNSGDGTFRDTSEQAAVTMGRWAWSSRFADINNDGRDDLVVANGFITNDDTHDL